MLRMTRISKIINKYKEFYFQQWRGHEKECPVFQEKVYVTRLGWNHIVFNKRHRSKDVVMRLKALILAKELLEKATIYQDRRIKNGNYFYAFDGIIRNKKIRVIVTSKGKKGKKIFLSVIYRA